MKKYFLSGVAVLALAAGYCNAAIPGKITYQGKLTNESEQLIDGTHGMTFKLYDALSGGTEKWTETHGSVQVTNGLFNVMLGSTTGLTSVFQANDALYLEITIDTEMLSPRQEMGSVGYALRAEKTSSDVAGGWTKADETWTYASATTITVPSGAASRYSVGDKLAFTQTTVKYFSVIKVTDTVLTVTGGSDYTVANGAITLPCYSKLSSPVGFPTWFNYTPTTTPNGSMTYTGVTSTSKFKIDGSSCTYSIDIDGVIGGTPNNTITVSLPVNTTRTQWCLGGAIMYSSSINQYGGTASNFSAQQVLDCMRYDRANLSAGISQAFHGQIVYPI